MNTTNVSQTRKMNTMRHGMEREQPKSIARQKRHSKGTTKEITL